MTIRVAIIGYGAVAAIHARQLARQPEVALAVVSGPDREKAAVFAAAHNVAHHTDDLNEAMEQADAAIIASPSPLHFEQARLSLQAGAHTLVELPPCETLAEAEALAELANTRGSLLRCAHTSRYLAPYLRIKQLIQSGALGQIEQINYLRHLAPRERSWTDDALLHHSAHPLDLLLDWFGATEAIGCVATSQSQNVSLLARLPTGAPVSISVSYASRLPQSRMLIVGSQHTIETDGFSFLRSDLSEASQQWDAQATYEQAIGAQDTDFIAACRAQSIGIEWAETIRLMRLVGEFKLFSEGVKQ